MLERTEGHILLFHLSGPMIFGVAKAIAREHNTIDDYEVLMLDLSDVPWLGVTSAMAIEAAVKEAWELGRRIYIIGATDATRKRLTKLQVGTFVPDDCWLASRQAALEAANLWMVENGHLTAVQLSEGRSSALPQ